MSVPLASLSTGRGAVQEETAAVVRSIGGREGGIGGKDGNLRKSNKKRALLE